MRRLKGEVMWLSEPDNMHRNYGIVYIGDRKDEFAACVQHVVSQSSALVFEEGIGERYCYFEFWIDWRIEENADWILNTAERIASAMDLYLHVGQPDQVLEVA